MTSAADILDLDPDTRRAIGIFADAIAETGTEGIPAKAVLFALAISLGYQAGFCAHEGTHDALYEKLTALGALHVGLGVAAVRERQGAGTA